jgi:predicted Rossmann-fold nucleotide-binding protein
MGSGEHAHERLARPLGAWVAHAGYHLLTGGGRATMEAAASAFTEIRPRRGMSIGIIPCRSADDHRAPVRRELLS